MIFEKRETGSHQQAGRQPPGRAHTRMNERLSQMFLGNCLPRHPCWNTNHVYTTLLLLLLTCVTSTRLKGELCCKTLSSLTCL